MNKNELQLAREQINQADERIAELFVQRMEAVAKIAEYKKNHGLPILDEAREQQVLLAGSQRVEDDELRAYYTEFLRQTMAVSRRYQQRLIEGMKVAYCGTAGAFAQIAAHKVFPDARQLAFGSFKEAYEAVCSGECDAAVLPMENSYAGEVGQVTDLIFSGPLFINGMIDLAVCHDLLGTPGSTLDGIKKVISHPQALSQCQNFIRQGGYEEEKFENTALAAEYVSELGDSSVAAIASGESAELYGLKILARGINESANNTTRFAVLSRSENRSTEARHGLHFVLMFTVRNEAGSLARALNIIGAHGFNMRTLRSRPMKQLLWEYYFYLEAEGNIHGYEGRCMLEELQICCDKLRAVGSFTLLN